MSNGVKFIHTADLHLGRPFRGLSSSGLSRELLVALDESFKRVIDLALEHQVDFVVIAGDVFDSGDVSYGVQRAFVDEMLRLQAAEIRVYLLTGNHDPLGSWGRRLSLLPDNVVVFPSDEVSRVTHIRDGVEIASLYGRGFELSYESANIALGYRRDPSDKLAIGLLHTDVWGADGYAPSSVSDLASAGMDYWALGHIHKTQVVAADPAVVYAGSPQGLNINESSDHGCYLVELEPGTPARYTFLKTARVAWESIEIDAGAHDSVDSLHDEILTLARQWMLDHGTPVCARVTLIGRSALHAELAAEGVIDELLDAVNGKHTTAGSWIRIDSILNKTSPLVDEQVLHGAGTFASVMLDVVEHIVVSETGASEIESQVMTEVIKTAGREVQNDVMFMDLLERAKSRALDGLGVGR